MLIEFSNLVNQWRFKMEFKELTEKIIGFCYKVYNTLGFGFIESV